MRSRRKREVGSQAAFLRLAIARTCRAVAPQRLQALGRRVVGVRCHRGAVGGRRQHTAAVRRQGECMRPPCNCLPFRAVSSLQPPAPQSAACLGHRDCTCAQDCHVCFGSRRRTREEPGTHTPPRTHGGVRGAMVREDRLHWEHAHSRAARLSVTVRSPAPTTMPSTPGPSSACHLLRSQQRRVPAYAGGQVPPALSRRRVYCWEAPGQEAALEHSQSLKLAGW